MSGSISFRTVISVTNGIYKDSVDTKNISITQTTLGAFSNIVTLGTGAYEPIEPTDITTKGLCYMRNIDPSGYSANIAVSGGGQILPFTTLESGYPAAVPMYTGSVLVGKSVGAGSSQIDIRIYEK